jgi:hypothetical protein
MIPNAKDKYVFKYARGMAIIKPMIPISESLPVTLLSFQNSVVSNPFLLAYQ